jgi:uncharacterized pyridoxal phosphate-containing UPF0001 family protein
VLAVDHVSATQKTPIPTSGRRKRSLTVWRANLPNIEMEYLSMGMSNSYQVAIEEGANMERLGTVLFEEREP